MKQERGAIHIIIVEAAIVLIAAILSLWLSKTIRIEVELTPLILMVIYI